MSFINKKLGDITSARIMCVDLSMFRKKENSSVLFSKGRKSNAFFTEDSKLYITPEEQKLLRRGMKLDRKIGKWDSLSSRIVRDYVRYRPIQKNQLNMPSPSKLVEALEERYEVFNDSLQEASRNFVGQFTLVRLWNLSIIGSILLGMVMMTFVYRYLGQGAAAEQIPNVKAAQTQSIQKNDFASQVLEIENADQKDFEREIGKMVKGYPIEKMVPYIAKKDRTVAAFLVGIAFKESTWGKHHPVLNGQDCYNYWGYRGQRNLMGSGGHTCFSSPQDAVDTVSKRLGTLIEKYNNDTPAEMVEPWKCGYDCEATGGRAAANQWVADVTKYFNKLNSVEEE